MRIYIANNSPSVSFLQVKGNLKDWKPCNDVFTKKSLILSNYGLEINGNWISPCINLKTGKGFKEYYSFTTCKRSGNCNFRCVIWDLKVEIYKIQNGELSTARVLFVYYY